MNKSCHLIYTKMILQVPMTLEMHTIKQNNKSQLLLI